jgi:pimeloyl-ACP methyl ester carboxylesterase
MTTCVELKIDVTEICESETPLHTAASVYLPEARSLTDAPVVCFAFPGGGYNRRYYSLDLVDGGCGQAKWHTDRGWIFVACDHLQFGDSSIMDPDVTTYELVAAGNRGTVESVLGKLASGEIHSDFPRIEDPTKIGIGQSMGGCFTIVAQAHHQLFDAVGILGYSGIHTVVPSPPGVDNVVMPHLTRVGFPSRPVVLNNEDLTAATATVAADADSLANAAGETGEHLWTWAFHHDDEPRDVVRRDMDAMSGGEIPPWRSATTAACGMLMVTPGTVAAEAASIDVPVLVAVGERDVVPDPWREPMAFPRSCDISVYVCPRMGHMHNFAPTRELFWARIHAFGKGVAEQAGLRARNE